MTLAEALGPARVALVLGAEGEGMRHNTEAHCDALARLPICGNREPQRVERRRGRALRGERGARLGPLRHGEVDQRAGGGGAPERVHRRRFVSARAATSPSRGGAETQSSGAIWTLRPSSSAV